MLGPSGSLPHKGNTWRGRESQVLPTTQLNNVENKEIYEYLKYDGIISKNWFQYFVITYFNYLAILQQTLTIPRKFINIICITSFSPNHLELNISYLIWTKKPSSPRYR